MRSARPIPGFPGYIARQNGKIACRQGLFWRNVPQNYIGEGYAACTLTDANGKQVVRPVHRLVLLAWLGAPPPGRTQARHLDGIRTNNRPENLAWGSASENASDRTIQLWIIHAYLNLGWPTERIVAHCGLPRRTVTSLLAHRCPGGRRAYERVRHWTEIPRHLQPTSRN